jgi:hypothetical protein
MSGSIDVGVIGTGAFARALIDHRAPLGRVRIAADPDLPVVIVLEAPERRAAIVAAALAAGKIVVCPPPAAMTGAEMAAIDAAAASGGGRLLIAGEIAQSEAGRRGLAAMLAPEFGALRSMYLAIRQPRGGDGDVIAALGWEAADFIVAAIPGGFSPVRVNAGALFGSARDTAVILLRSAANAVVTVELSRCLPPSLAAPGLGEVEIDAMGAAQAVRITPLASAVQIHRDDGRDLVPWLNAPAFNMLRTIETAVDDPGFDGGGLDRARRSLALMMAILA